MLAPPKASDFPPFGTGSQRDKRLLGFCKTL